MRDGGSEEFKDEFKSHRLYMVHSKVNKEIDEILHHLSKKIRK